MKDKKLTKPFPGGNAQVPIPLAILNTVFVNKSSLESNKLLVDVSDAFENLLKFLLGETMLSVGVMSTAVNLTLLLLNPSWIPSNTGLQAISVVSSDVEDANFLQMRAAWANTFLAEDFLDLAEEFPDFATEYMSSDNLFYQSLEVV